MVLSGKVIAILPLQTGAGKNGFWQSQDFVIETTEQYPKKIAINLFGEKIEQLPKIDETVSVEVNIESREYNGKWYTKVSAWKFNGNTTTTTAPPAQIYGVQQPENGGSGLPFDN